MPPPPPRSPGADSPDRADDPRARRRIVNAEINARRVNEALERGTDPITPTVFVCECGELGCSTTLTLRTDEYEAVRSDFERFVVVPGHEVDGIDEVVERHRSHLVVAKSGHDAAEAARRTDPRADDRG
jgi:hypothetical protein